MNSSEIIIAGHTSINNIEYLQQLHIDPVDLLTFDISSVLENKLINHIWFYYCRYGGNYLGRKLQHKHKFRMIFGTLSELARMGIHETPFNLIVFFV